MKKLIALILVFFSFTIFCSCSERSNIPLSPDSTDAAALETEISARTPSSETLTLAEDVLKLMEEENVSLSKDLSSDIGVTDSDVYSIYKEHFPIMQDLEDREDSALALLALYEEHIAALEESGVYRSICENMAKQLEDSNYKFRFEEPEQFSAYVRRDNIESLLAMRVYFDRLDSSERMRLADALCRRYNIAAEPEMEVYGFVWTVRFFDLNGERLFENVRFSFENEFSLSYVVSDD